MKMQFLNSFGTVVELPVADVIKRGYYYTIPVNNRTRDVVDVNYARLITYYEKIVMQYVFASVGALLDFIDLLNIDKKRYEDIKNMELKAAIEYLMSEKPNMCEKCPYKDMKGAKINSNPINATGGIKVKS